MGEHAALATERRLRVLNVHADESVRAFRSVVLGAAGYDVIDAGDASAALDKALGRPDLILLDVHLPHLHAFELMVRLKGSPATRSIPVLATALAEVGGAASNARAAGASALVPNSAEPSRLTAEVAALLDRRFTSGADRCPLRGGEAP